MGNKSRIFVFILLNIIVSASVTLIVLWLWQLAHPRPEIGTSRLDPSASISTGTQQTPSISGDDNESGIVITNEDIQISIRTIVGVGNLDVEFVEIINQGQNPADLTGWQLTDEDGNQYTFPALILNSGGAVKVLTKTGTNTVIELYWQADAPVWRSGEIARLVNTSGEVVSTYAIP
jgi:hypothetical protein